MSDSSGDWAVLCLATEQENLELACVTVPLQYASSVHTLGRIQANSDHTKPVMLMGT